MTLSDINKLQWLPETLTNDINAVADFIGKEALTEEEAKTAFSHYAKNLEALKQWSSWNDDFEDLYTDFDAFYSVHFQDHGEEPNYIKFANTDWVELIEYAILQKVAGIFKLDEDGELSKEEAREVAKESIIATIKSL